MSDPAPDLAVYPFLALIVVILHLLFVLFVMAGALLVLRRPRLVWLHLPAVVWGSLVEFTGWTCPLTPIELWLRVRGGRPGYTAGFVEHYLLPLLYPAWLDESVQLRLGLLAVAVNVLLYVGVWRCWRTGGRGTSR